MPQKELLGHPLCKIASLSHPVSYRWVLMVFFFRNVNSQSYNIGKSLTGRI
uniref:Uncharacterized protein n=1 Tax=Utricularia reniformis TaxID=192314 RepID=A0A1Y0AZG3_9LAMI|nr:hypothetical protein AEK19_MT0243 [Utricularia reniformis]ART30521.1 hypothetical protein AEK19_MT0243 [Utricularia reniformis]